MTKTNFYRNSNFREGSLEDTYLLPEEVAQVIAMVLSQREGTVISETTLKLQKNQIQRGIYLVNVIYGRL